MTSAHPRASTTLDKRECLELLRANPTQVGRLALSDARPTILPVNYLVDGDTIVFRTAEGTKYQFVRRGSYVAFEADDLDATTRTGWSVVARGWVQEVTDADQRADLERRAPEPWIGGDKPRFARITPETVSGRRITDAGGGQYPPIPPDA